MNTLFELIYNFGILVSISIISGFVGHRGDKSWNKSLLQGVLFGSASIIGMLHPLALAPGLIFDGRSVMISLSALFFGPLAATITGTMALLLRIYQGGTGVIMGTLVIIMSATIGTMLYIRNKRRNIEVTISLLFFMGIIVHIAMILLMLTLPDGNSISTIKLMGIQILLIYPIATVLIGRILLEANERRRIVHELRESQTNLTFSNENLKATMEELVAVEEELRSQFEELKIKNELIIESENQFNSALDNAPIPIMLRADDGEVLKISRRWTEITGYTIQDIPTINDWTTKAYGADKLRTQGVIKSSYNSNSPEIDGEYKITCAKGKVRIWEFNFADIGKLTDGRKVVMTAAMDITDRKREEDELKTSEEKYRIITENASDVISVLNLTKRKFTYVSPSMFYLRGLTAAEAMNENFEESLTPESLVYLREVISRKTSDFIKDPTTPNYYVTEIQQPCKNGNVIWVELSTKYRYNADGDIETVCVSRNIEERKKIEKEILYLSYRDQLTGLYNRRFYEEELKRLDTERNLPLTIAMGDVNGLKLINDSFGHVMGDKLLKKVAEAIKKECRADDIIARLGGDEFVIILPKTNAIEAERVVKRIKNILSKEKVGAIDISISFGYGTKNNGKENIQEIFKNTEDHMYRHKLSESMSIRSKTIDLVMNTLFEKNNREMLHSKRVSKICESIAYELGMEADAVNTLKTAGLMHDIGKIGIDERILNKPQDLSDDEWNEVKRHPEIGYRILSSVNEFSEIADYVLEHHERWDGKGYPRGLKGKEISVQARIMAVADSYDAMTSERSYRSTLPEEVALKELLKNAGIQFEPEIVSVFIGKVLGKI